MTDKREIVVKAVGALEARIAEMRRLSDGARAEATHEETRPENDKDTRATEASYLARGQAARVAELEHEAQLLRFLEAGSGAAGDAITLGALVTLDVAGERRTVFVAPAGGGLRIQVGAEEVLLVTPSAPLGRALLGRRTGDVLELPTRGTVAEHEILAVE